MLVVPESRIRMLPVLESRVRRRTMPESHAGLCTRCQNHAYVGAQCSDKIEIHMPNSDKMLPNSLKMKQYVFAIFVKPIDPSGNIVREADEWIIRRGYVPRDGDTFALYIHKLHMAPQPPPNAKDYTIPEKL